MQQQKELIKEVTYNEILEAVKTMPKDKAPGVDGFPIEFFTKNWEVVQEDVLEAVTFLQKWYYAPCYQYYSYNFSTKDP